MIKSSQTPDNRSLPMLTHSKVLKYAFIGTSSSGKTTATYQTCGYLKANKIRVDGILQQDRRLPFDAALLPTHAEAQYWFLTNQMTVENYLMLQRGVDVLVSDRSVLDFFAYTCYQWTREMVASAWFPLTQSWVTTYKRLYYLKPRAYDDDGVRPSDEFRLGVDLALQNLIEYMPRGIIVPVDDWKDAARQIAIESRTALIGEDAFLVGSWGRGEEKEGSDFDFAMTLAMFDALPVEVREQFVDSSPSRIHPEDKLMCQLVESDSLNMDIQLYRTQADFEERKRHYLLYQDRNLHANP